MKEIGKEETTKCSKCRKKKRKPNLFHAQEVRTWRLLQKMSSQKEVEGKRGRYSRCTSI